MTRRIAVVDEEKCHPDVCGNFLCIRFCPVNRSGGECIIKNETETKIKILEDTCIDSCSICTKKCPYGAIKIVNLPGELDEEPIHRYSENGFALYNVPVPKFGKVVGIIGKNGIGKSTAMKILAGHIKPNLGNFKTETKHEDIISKFKGTEAHKYFELLNEKKIKVAFKPQHVEQIPNSFNGTVRELLEKVDEKNKLEEYAKHLEIYKILDRDIKQVSGGELQRIAITATALKKANVYFFDEPTSYLDIKQRLKVSDFIRNLTNENTGVVLIEHDLIILDYMADLIHVTYGKEAIYGVVSQPKTTKIGINEYLEGYLHAENIKFRDKKIEFLGHGHEDGFVSKITITEWKDFQKELGNFKLNISKGSIHKREVIGILGQNGIGKTTFAKVIAGLDKNLKDKIEPDNVKIAYKPQYIETDDTLVMQVLTNAIENYENTIIEPLNIKPLLERQLNELSGGELQRVAIAATLSNEKADIYLLDEPSAYLDIEQRLIIAKILKDFLAQKEKCAIVIDHDLLFMDYISNRITIFTGIPSKIGNSYGPYEKIEGMNKFLKEIQVTFRRDEENNRPRANKPNSQLDLKQRSNNEWYY